MDEPPDSNHDKKIPKYNPNPNLNLNPISKIKFKMQYGSSKRPRQSWGQAKIQYIYKKTHK